MRIGASLREGAQSEVVLNPYDASPVGEVAVASAADMDDAIAAAAAGFEIARRLPAHARAASLEGIARRIEERAEELARLIVRESGKPIRFARGEVARAVITFRLGAQEALSERGEVLEVGLEPRSVGRTCIATRAPRGPVAAITPFNFPLNLAAHKLSPMLAIGASGVLKPPPQCPLTGHELIEIAVQSGYPAEALSVLHAHAEVAQRLAADPRIAVLSFTGSDGVGWKLKALAPRKQVLLELGGNAPCVIDADVDVGPWLEPLAHAAFGFAGQVCIKVQRILVHASRIDEFLERFAVTVAGIAVGDPMREETIVGPMIDDAQAARVTTWVRRALDAGARRVCGGESDGRLVAPTVLTHAHAGLEVVREELFGPVVVVEAFQRFDEALALCNSGRFGLQVGVLTADIGRALEAARSLEFGAVLINDLPTFRVDNYPYGGTKDSGFGREGVRYAAREMCESRVVMMRGLPG